MRTYVYIDGFNLFYGLLKGSPYKWLNLEELFDAVLPRNQIVKVRYFTAMVEARDNDPDLPVRQATYLRALATLPRVEVQMGTFLSSPVKAPVLERGPNGLPRRVNGRLVLKRAPSGAPVMEYFYKSEEKGSDVNLAAHLLRDAYRGDCDCAVIVSNDSDLLTPIRMVKADQNLVVGWVPPRQRGSVELRQVTTFKKEIRQHQLAAAQFPNSFADINGTIHRPQGW